MRCLPLVLASALVAGCVVWPAGGGPSAAPLPLAEALARVERGEAVLVDVRSPESYAEGHIPGALNVPFDQVEARATDLRRKARQAILYCG
jgi:rhodanese-related sulfurtransferase